MLGLVIAALVALQSAPSNAPPRQLSLSDVPAIQKLAGNYCEPEINAISTFRLDAQHTLGIVGCTQGPYQGASLIIVIDEAGRWVPAPIEPTPLQKQEKPFEPYLLDQAGYSEARLTTCTKARAMDDCDIDASWAWDGRKFRLVSYETGGVSHLKTLKHSRTNK